MRLKNFKNASVLKFGLVCCLLFISFFAYAQKKVERPFQVQLNFAGTFIKTFGQALSDPEVDKFDSEDWLFPGIDIGYHLNNTFFLGYSFQPSRTQILEEPWGLSYAVRDADIAVRYQSGNYHNFNLRVSPFRNGLYASASFLLITKADYEMNVNRMAEMLAVGEGFYQTDLIAEWHFKKAVTFGTGLGYNQLFNNGLSLAFGVLVPFVASPYYEDIQLKTTAPEISIVPDDQRLAIEKLREETFFYPVQFNLRLGYNFNFK